MENHKQWKNIIDSSWTLFLDRDGVINRRLPDDYVKRVEEFEFLPMVLEAMSIFSRCFAHIVVVTNQQGIGKGLMGEEDLEAIHKHMLCEINLHGGRLDGIFHCPQLRDAVDNYRKPNPTMAYMAQQQFPDINMRKSIMIGDSVSDIVFGRNVGMSTIFIGSSNNDADDVFCSLYEFAKTLI